MLLKKWLQGLCVVSFAIALSSGASAAFTRQQSYSNGMFTDVAASEWYAESVKDAYEFGLMNGDSVSTFSPSGTLSVAEGITVASRLYSTLTDIAIPESNGGEWYEKYVAYALSNGLMKADEFDSYERELKRYEMARLLASASESILSDVNVMEDIPDVPKNHHAYKAIQML